MSSASASYNHVIWMKIPCFLAWNRATRNQGQCAIITQVVPTSRINLGHIGGPLTSRCTSKVFGPLGLAPRLTDVFAGRSKPVTVIAVITVIQLAGGEQEEEEENLGFGDSVHVRDTAHWDHHDHGSIEGAISTDPSVPSTIVGA